MKIIYDTLLDLGQIEIKFTLEERQFLFDPKILPLKGAQTKSRKAKMQSRNSVLKVFQNPHLEQYQIQYN